MGSLPKTALLAGATGLIGSQLLLRLLEDTSYGKVIALSRKPMSIHHPKLEVRIVTLATLSEIAATLKADDWFCTLGTTIKQAGSQEAFRRVDYEYPMALGQQAVASGAQQYLIVTAIGASAASSIFYSMVKGEVERDLGLLPIPVIQLFRPSQLLGERKELRPGERWAGVLMKVINPLLRGPLRKYRAIRAEVVAAAMIKAANTQQHTSGIHVYEGDQIVRLGEK